MAPPLGATELNYRFKSSIHLDMTNTIICFSGSSSRARQVCGDVCNSNFINLEVCRLDLLKVLIYMSDLFVFIHSDDEYICVYGSV